MPQQTLLGKQLHYRGLFQSSWFNKSLTVVGSRKMTNYGRAAVARLVPQLVEAGVTLISGFMYGVDQEVHRRTLEFGGRTVAVMGWGIDWAVGPEDLALFKEIEKKGLIVSEYALNTVPQLWMFPARDRLMAQLGQGTLVIEAAKRSGSLITADYAGKLKRPLFAVPGPITSAVSAGTNELIQSGRAVLVTTAGDILSVLGYSHRPPLASSTAGQLPPILDCLSREALSVEELVEKTQLAANEVRAQLTVAELRGEVTEVNGKYSLNNVNQN